MTSAGSGPELDEGVLAPSTQKRDWRPPSWPLIKVALTFLAVFVFLDTIVVLLGNALFLEPLGVWMTSATAAALRLLGIETIVEGKRFSVGEVVLSMDGACLALNLKAMYVALVVAYPVEVRKKLVGVAFGLPVIFVANYIRLILTGVAADSLSRSAFTFAHDYMFMIFMVFVVLLVWVAWLEWVRRHAR